jgi:hypothetical protein
MEGEAAIPPARPSPPTLYSPAKNTLKIPHVMCCIVATCTEVDEVFQIDPKIAE